MQAWNAFFSKKHIASSVVVVPGYAPAHTECAKIVFCYARTRAVAQHGATAEEDFPPPSEAESTAAVEAPPPTSARSRN